MIANPKSPQAIRDAKHLANVRKLPSCISWREPCEAHHLKAGPAKLERGIGLRSGDNWAVPLTTQEHWALEQYGSRREIEWFIKKGVPDIVTLAIELWTARENFEAMKRVILGFGHEG
jgi:hypothetical protein